jgi:phosphoribosyl-AMP cyclohydrolase
MRSRRLVSRCGAERRRLSCCENARVTDLQNLLDRVRFNDAGLVPAIAQQWDTREVLMLAWMSADSLSATISTGQATYFSRSRQSVWVKGETSGHRQAVRSIQLDCDGDALLVLVEQIGPACHRGDRTCFDEVRVELIQPEPIQPESNQPESIQPESIQP